MRETTGEEWRRDARQRFGDDQLTWRFVCPACGHVASIADWKAAGAPITSAAFSCVGRWMSKPRDAFGDGPGPCNYAGGGLIGLNPVRVADGPVAHDVFEFAEP